MYILLVFTVVLVVSCNAATVSSTHMCHSSHECGTSMCCRSLTGTVVSNTEMGGFGGPFLPMGNHQQNGTCSTRLAQKGEVCDSNCQCDVGLACYRPMSGVCCPPHTCYDEAYVTQQKEYWAKCFSDPSCAIPP